MARDRVDLSVRAELAQTRPENDDTGEGGPAADTVDDGGTSEVPEARGREPAAPPYPVTRDWVNEADEQEREDDEREVFDAFSDRA